MTPRGPCGSSPGGQRPDSVRIACSLCLAHLPAPRAPNPGVCSAEPDPSQPESDLPPGVACLCSWSHVPTDCSGCGCAAGAGRSSAGGSLDRGLVPAFVCRGRRARRPVRMCVWWTQVFGFSGEHPGVELLGHVTPRPDASGVRTRRTGPQSGLVTWHPTSLRLRWPVSSPALAVSVFPVGTTSRRGPLGPRRALT